MTDPQQKLTSQQVREADGLDDWRLLLTGIRARFRTGDFATGLALVDRIGAAAEEADHHPDISLTYPEVIVTLSSHDVGGITTRDLDLARRISGFAAEEGIAADVAGLTQLEPGLDTTAGERLSPFYAALLGGEVADHGEPRRGTARSGREEARAVMRELARVGVDMDDVTETLEREGLEKFVADWSALLGSISGRLSTVEG